jgi:ABC-type protease/lipase transport system fused ATPase/permease subunit
MLELKDASLAVGGRQMFRRLSLMAHEGQVTCITGGEGSGKTLLLRVMMGFVPLDGGLVSIDGELLTPLSATVFRRQMAYVPQYVASSPSTFVPDTSDLETVWGGGEVPAMETRPIEMPVVTIQDKAIVLADDPDVAMLGQLKALASSGRTVVVASCREEYLTMSDKIVNLQDDEYTVS